MGEGWHNYHHAFPWDYKAGEWGKGYNYTRKIIEFFQRIGWAYDLREASQTVVNGKAKRLGDGSHIPAGPPTMTQLSVDTSANNLSDDSPNILHKSVTNSDGSKLPVAAEDTQRTYRRMVNHG